MNFDTPRHPLSPEEFRLLRSLVHDYAGIYFHDEMRYILERRLAGRIDALHLSGFADYIRYLRYNPKGRIELEELTEQLTTNETYFFREDFQLSAFSDEVLPQLMGGKDSPPLRIWSAGCSSGEEPYTIAMLALESGITAARRVEIFANDISRKVLVIARRGVYGRSSFRQTPSRYRHRYFTAQDGKHQVSEDVKSLVTFGHLNLLDRQRVSTLRPFDVIFCRNVLIYFDVPAKRQVVENFYRVLRPGGYLLLGHSESLINLSSAFELVHLKRDMVYRKPPKGGRSGDER